MIVCCLYYSCRLQEEECQAEGVTGGSGIAGEGLTNGGGSQADCICGSFVGSSRKNRIVKKLLTLALTLP